MSGLFSQVKLLWQRWHHTVTRGITQVSLSMVYVFGIGLTSLVARVFGKKFLQSRFNGSSWQPMTGSQRLEKMF